MSVDDGLRQLDAEVANCLEPKPEPPDPNSCPFLLLEEPEKSPEGFWLHVHIFEHGDACEWMPRGLSSDISAAMHVVEKMQERGFRVFIRDYEGVITWEVTFTSHVSGTACGNELPDVICRAALKATECLSISARPDDGPASLT